MTIKYRKLGKERADGQVFHSGLIEIDERLRGKQLLKTIIHEFYHHYSKDFTEEIAEPFAKALSDLLWKQHYRKTDG